MKNILKFLSIAASAVFVLLLIARLTGMLEYYTVPTIASEPAIKPGAHLLATNLKDPIVGDFVAYEIEHYLYGDQDLVSRMCAIAGDKVQFIHGVFYRNDVDSDTDYNLQHLYSIKSEKLEALEKEGLIYKRLNDSPINNGRLVRVYIEDVNAKNYDLEKFRYAQDSLETHPLIVKKYNEKWNSDFFGPVIVPEGHVFVLGDNRDNSFDSRFTGAVHEESVKSVVFKIFN